MKSPAPERQVRGDALGSVQGKKAQGLMVQQASNALERGLSGAQEGKVGRLEESFAGWVFCSFKSAKCHWSLPLWIRIFKIKVFEKGWDLFRDRTS